MLSIPLGLAGHRMEEEVSRLVGHSLHHHPGVLPPQPLVAPVLGFDFGGGRSRMVVMLMMAAGGLFPQSVEVVVVRGVVVSAAESELSDAVAVLLLLPGDPSLVAALAARPRLGGDDLFVQGRPASLTNLPKRRNVFS